MKDIITQRTKLRDRRLTIWRTEAPKTLRTAICLVFLYFSPGCSFRTYWKLKKEHQTLAEDTKNLQQNNAELAEEIERLQKDEVYLEKVAREKYKMLKENEEVYQY